MGEKMQFTELDQYLFGQGTHYDIYKKLGAHPTTQGRKKGVYFAVWAPRAQSVSVIGDFNNWDEEANPMTKAGPIGVFEVFVPGAKIGDLYKFFIIGMHGEKLYKADPYANEAEMRQLPILQTMYGKMRYGSRTARILMKKSLPWLSMKYIPVPGRSIPSRKKTKTVSIITENSPMSLRNM